LIFIRQKRENFADFFVEIGVGILWKSESDEWLMANG